MKPVTFLILVIVLIVNIGGEYPDELRKGTHICVIGIDKTDGRCYVLHTGIEREK